MQTLQELSCSLNAGTAKRACLGRGKALGDLWQPVTQNGRVHLHIVELGTGETDKMKWQTTRHAPVLRRLLVGGTFERSFDCIHVHP